MFEALLILSLIALPIPFSGIDVMAIFLNSFSNLARSENKFAAASVKSPLLLKLGSLNFGPKPIKTSSLFALFALILRGTEGE